MAGGAFSYAGRVLVRPGETGRSVAICEQAVATSKGQSSLKISLNWSRQTRCWTQNCWAGRVDLLAVHQGARTSHAAAWPGSAVTQN
jgi:hypothetical protein